MSEGVIVVAGQFPPNTVVKLVRVQDETVLRAEYGETVDERVVGADGSVTFDSAVEVGARYFVCGYAKGLPLELRARGEDPAASRTELAQPPIVPSAQTVGTQEDPLKPELPSVPEELPNAATEAETVVKAEPESDGATHFFPKVDPNALFVWIGAEPVPGPDDVPGWQRAEVRIPDSSDHPLVPLWHYVGEKQLTDTDLEWWSVYEGDTEPVPVEAAPEEVSGDNNAHERLVAQAIGLSVPNALTLTVDELRQSITEKNSEPVA